MRFEIEQRERSVEVRMMVQQTMVHAVILPAPVDDARAMSLCVDDYRQSSAMVAEMFERRIADAERARQ